MKCLVLFVLVALAAVSAQVQFKKDSYVDLLLGRHEPYPPARNPRSKRSVSQGSVTQRLDHFTADNLDTFVQRFFASYEHYDVASDGPLFILVGGEFPASDSWLEGGFMYDLAEEFNGAMFYLEHRFYGESVPENHAADVDTLQYLTTDQALYDLAYFIEQIRFIVPEFNDDPIILVGGGLGGSLLTWFQRDYGSYYRGAWASSAPLESDDDFAEAMEVSGAVLRFAGGDACYNRVRGGFAGLEDLFEAGDYATIRSQFNVCPTANIESENGQWILFDILGAEFGAILRFAGQPGLLNAVCNIMLDADDDVQGLADFQSTMFGDSCLNFDYETTVSLLSTEDWSNPQIGARLGLFERCNEFGWWPTSTSDHQPFGSSFPVTLFHRLCESVFGEDFSAEDVIANINDFNDRYGGVNPEPQIENTFTTQGQFDWLRPAGAQEDFGPEAPVHIIDNAGFMQDMYSYAIIADAEDLYATQRRIRDAVEDWLSN